MKSNETEPKKIPNRMIVMLFTVLVIGIVVGYGTGYLVYQPEISRLQISLSAVQSDLSIIQAEISSLESEFSKSQEEPIADPSLLVNKSLPFEAVVGDNLVLGKITENRADLGTLPQGSTAQFQLPIYNNAERPQRLLLSVEGNASIIIKFDVIELLQPGSTASVTILINASVEKGFYYGVIVIKGVYA